MTAALLEARGVGCRHGRAEVLAGIDLRLAPGEVLGLLGPNGAGKSTLLRCLGGLQRPAAGAVELMGQPLASYSRSALARTLAYVPQAVGTAMALRVVEMVALGRLPHRGSAGAAQDAAVVGQALARLGLEPLALRPYNELSGGERQRVLIARALAQEGQLLLLDEPTSGLDLRHQLAALTTVRSLAADRGLGVVVALHDLALSARFCDRLLLLHGGHAQAQGPWREVLTPARIAQVFGVRASIGTDGPHPYVIALEEKETS